MHHLLVHINKDILKGDTAKIMTQQYIKLNTRAKEILAGKPSKPLWAWQQPKQQAPTAS